MPKAYVLYLSTNTGWGGSELLWTESAVRLRASGHQVKAGAKYDYQRVKSFFPDPRHYLDLRQHLRPAGLMWRVLKKIKVVKAAERNLLLEEFSRQKPDLVVISQGNNVAGRQYMMDCAYSGVPFVTVTQLVVLNHWPAADDDSLDSLIRLYDLAKRNYFVSLHTLRMHERFLGAAFNNTTLVYNPFTKNIPTDMTYPPLDGGNVKVALVGRMEAFHKGYDILLDVIKADKWKSRPIHFSFFGSGPHERLLRRLAVQNSIMNVSFHPHIEAVEEIWKTHHLLMMPSRMEGQSLSLIEAMHYKRSAIVTSAGGTDELIDEGVSGFISKHCTMEAIDASLEQAWQRRGEWEDLGINAAVAISRKHPADASAFFNEKIEEILSGLSVSKEPEK